MSKKLGDVLLDAEDRLQNEIYGIDVLKPIDLDKVRYLVVDFETTIRNRGEDAVGKQAASPHHPDNKICYYAYTGRDLGGSPFLNASHVDEVFSNSSHVDTVSTSFITEANRCNLLVGQNFKFDMLYLLKEHGTWFKDWLRRGGMIWDTMVVEYLLTNQMSQFASLDNLSEKYGGTIKDDRIKEYWKNGIDTPEIPENEISEYARGDIENTSIVFRAQYLEAKRRGPEFMNLINTQMDAIIATTFMEFNGMHFDVNICSPLALTMAKEYDRQDEQLRTYMANEFNAHCDPDWPVIENGDVNPGSVQQVATLLFGGTFKYRKQLPIKDENGNPTRYVSGARKGAIKTKWHELEIVIDPEHSIAYDYADLMSKTEGGAYQVDDKNLKKIGGAAKRFCDLMIKYRAISKDLHTYFIGYMELVWPTDNCIHGNINHCSTGTGRTSSTSPNIQNVSG
jgi:DNA polymerase I-like protein with 3'-5' exonuclease and polymerase domains